jgi:DNA replication protein DnaC
VGVLRIAKDYHCEQRLGNELVERIDNNQPLPTLNVLQEHLLLKELKLPAFSRHYQYHEQQAIENGYSHIRYLSGLCEQEIADRYQQRVQKWAKEAKLPPSKRFANLNLTELSSSVQQQVIALKD